MLGAFPWHHSYFHWNCILANLFFWRRRQVHWAFIANSNLPSPLVSCESPHLCQCNLYVHKSWRSYPLFIFQTRSLARRACASPPRWGARKGPSGPSWARSSSSGRWRSTSGWRAAEGSARMGSLSGSRRRKGWRGRWVCYPVSLGSISRHSLYF